MLTSTGNLNKLYPGCTGARANNASSASTTNARLTKAGYHEHYDSYNCKCR